MTKELEEDREETQDPEVEFAIAGAMMECGGLNLILSMVQVSRAFIFLHFLCPFWAYPVNFISLLQTSLLQGIPSFVFSIVLHCKV
jgi:hypothetical protein